MNVLNPLGFLAEIKCGISLTSVSFIWGEGRLTFLDAGHELDLKGLSFNFFSPVLCDSAGDTIAFLAWKAKGGGRGLGQHGRLCWMFGEHVLEDRTCEMQLGVGLCA